MVLCRARKFTQSPLWVSSNSAYTVIMWTASHLYHEKNLLGAIQLIYPSCSGCSVLVLIQRTCLKKNKMPKYKKRTWWTEMEQQRLLLFFFLLTFEGLHCTQQFIRLTHLVVLLPDVMWHSPSGTWESGSTSLFWQQPLSPSTGCFYFLSLLCWVSITLTHIFSAK